MASIVLRRDGRAEIRESISTERGPRSRTLAVFRELTDRDLDKAQRRAIRPFDRSRILRRARDLGVPRYGESASRAAVALLGELHRGRPLDAALVGAVRSALEGRPHALPEASLEPLYPWLGADDEERGERLREALRALPGGRGAASTDARYGRAQPPRMSTEKLAPLDDRLAVLASELAGASLEHGFGGDLALAYHAPGGTPRHLQLWVFASDEAARPVAEALAKIAPVASDLLDSLTRGTAQVALGGTAVLAIELDLDRPAPAAARRTRELPFGEDRIRVLGPEDWLLARLLGSGPRDDDTVDADLERILFSCAGRLDVDAVTATLERAPHGEALRAWLGTQVQKLTGTSPA